MPVLAKFIVEPEDQIGQVLHESMLGDRVISDAFHFFFTLNKMQEEEFIEEFVTIPKKFGIWFLKMNEPVYKYVGGKWLTQDAYRVSQERLSQLFEKFPVMRNWTDEEKLLAKRYYRDYYGIVAKNQGNLSPHKLA